MTHVDLAIIGSGSGNSLITPDFDDLTVAMIEANPVFGGTCLNVGCIPTKMFVYAAQVATTIRESARYGIDATLDGVRWRDIRDRIFGRIDPISAGGRDYRRSGEPNTSLYEGEARFVGPRLLEVATAAGPERLSAERIVLASGSRPVIPAPIAESGVPFHTSDTVMRIDELPASIAIVGGGFIAAEFAHVFSSLGVAVTIVTRGPAMLRAEDPDIAAAFTAQAVSRWDVRLSAQVSSAVRTQRGVRLDLTDGTHAEAELLLVATGRTTNADRLDPAAGGIETHPDGRIKVDAHGRTSAEGVWALGDVSSAHQLKHVANAEARIVAHNLAHPGDLRAIDERFVPAAVFTHPQIASVGLREDDARAQGFDVTTAVQAFGDVAYGWAMEDATGLVKLVADRASGRLLGAHLMCPDASVVVHQAIQAMQFGLRVQEMARGQFWIHPAMSEVLENALLGLDVDWTGVV
ncbi:mycothione reductase [Pseudactinotalea sp. HY160]|uniref:mycothione reductase n=1 Tax=Pseudactinotalea sp. HY160 TaxID=2654490 RepID=UPI001313828F|nr:mycothione reductase [Pseudactinotalea sp. HY160]